jgi:hypothetical protein
MLMTCINNFFILRAGWWANFPFLYYGMIFNYDFRVSGILGDDEQAA